MVAIFLVPEIYLSIYQSIIKSEIILDAHKYTSFVLSFQCKMTFLIGYKRTRILKLFTEERMNNVHVL